MIYAKRGVGKTFVALAIALAIAKGESFLRWGCPKARKVLYVDGEMPLTIIQERIIQLSGQASPGAAIPNDLRIITPDNQKLSIPDLATREGQAQIDDALADAELLILDNLSALCRSGKENEGEGWLPLQGWLLSLRQRGVSTLLVHHGGKNGSQRGTSRREDLLDTVIMLKNPTDYRTADGLHCEVHFEKNRSFYGEEAKPFEIKLQIEGGRAEWKMAEARDATLERAAELRKEGKSIRETADLLGLTKSKVGRMVKDGDKTPLH